jgi:ornithine carbamoyltransferase
MRRYKNEKEALAASFSSHKKQKYILSQNIHLTKIFREESIRFRLPSFYTGTMYLGNNTV